MTGWHNRQAQTADMPAIIEIFDAAQRWLVAHKLEGQWGSTPVSQLPQVIERMEGWVGDQLVRLALNNTGRVHGCLVLGFNAPPYLGAEVVQVMSQDAGYVYALATRKESASRGSGAFLLGWAEQAVRDRGGYYLRTDCWADNEALRAYYQRQGFTPCGTYQANEWCGVLMEKSLGDSEH